MIAWRLARVLLHLGYGLLSCALVFPFSDVAGRARRIQQWSFTLLTLCDVRIELTDVSGASTDIHALIVSNHVSWLDIFVINAVQPCRFVAKSEIRNWPLVGWLCQQTGTIFIARGTQRDVRRIYRNLVDSIRAGERIAFFPEGTTAAQGSLLSFHANLFEAAIEAEAAVQPYALRYVTRDGRLHDAADFVGDMTFSQSMIRVLRARRMVAQLTLLPVLPSKSMHRRELAADARASIAHALGYVDEEARNSRFRRGAEQEVKPAPVPDIAGSPPVSPPGR